MPSPPAGSRQTLVLSWPSCPIYVVLVAFQKFAQTLRNTLYKSNQAQPSSNVNMQHYYSTCSNNRVRFLPSEFLVVEVDLPCT